MKKAILLALCVAGLWSQARAEENPAPSPKDPRMRYLAYDPGQVVRLSTSVGATLVVTFSAAETITAVAVSDSKDLAAMPRGNYLFFKSRTALPSQPVIVLTTSETGKRRYVFDIVTTAMENLTPDQADLYYSVQFIYPADEAAAKRQAAEARAAAESDRRKERDEKIKLAQAHDTMEQRTRDPFVGPRNWRYVAQGNHSLLPLEVFDNGYSTVFRFPGNVRIPSVFVINPDGKEATANTAVKGDLVQVGSVARGWRLRDGNTVLCIWNQAYDPVGERPSTETVSPDVQRKVKEAPQ